MDTAAEMAVVGLVSVNSPAYVRAAFAALRAGQVVVPLRGADDTQRIEAGGVRQVVVPEADAGWIDEAPLTDRSDRLAQVMFTSGTEGEPKGVELTHAALDEVVQRLNRVMKLDATVREYVGVPVYHSFGFGRCRAVAAAGGRAFIPARGFNPIEIAQMLGQGEINAVSAVPSLWRILLASDAITPELGRQVRWIEIGSQAMSRDEKLKLRALFPQAVIVQHYGLTEASRSTLLEVHVATPEQLDSVGRALGDVQVRIDHDGRIALRGPHVSQAMRVGGERVATLDADGWLRTGDLGELRDGFLYYLGRADDVINVGGLKLSPELIESHMREALGLAGGIAVCRVSDELRGHGLLVSAIASVAASDAQLLEAAAAAAQAHGVNARGAIHVQRIEALPQTASGKVQRQKLSRDFHPAAAATPAAPSARGGGSLREVVRKVLGVPQVRDGDTFTQLGGDSLAYIQVSLAIESRLGYLPEGWENSSLAELERLPARKASRVKVEAMIWLRALAIMVIVSNAVEVFAPHLFPGGAYLLFVLAGASFARFQLRKALQDDSARPIVAGLPRIVIPTVLLLLVQQLRHHEVSLPPLLLVDNLMSPELGGYWFIDTWVQIYLVMGLAFWLLPLARVAREHPERAALGALAVAVALRWLMPFVWNTDALYNRVPHMNLWLFALGWAIVAAGARHRLLLTVCIVVLGVAGMYSPVHRLWVVGGALALLWLRPLPMPTVIARVLAWISAASLYIYIGEAVFISKAVLVLPQLGRAPAWLAMLVGGVLLHWLVDWLWSRGRLLLKGRAAESTAESPVA